MRLRALGGLSLFCMSVGSPVPAAAAETRCAPVAVPVAPVAGTDFRVYEGRTAAHRIRFASERPGVLVDAFPEPPVRIIRRATGAECEIREGGVWARSGVYVGAGGRRLVLLETSGSNAALVVYDPNSCARLGEVDVSEARWRFVESGVDIGRDCTGTTIDGCRTQVTARLGSDCTVAAK